MARYSTPSTQRQKQSPAATPQYNLSTPSPRTNSAPDTNTPPTTSRTQPGSSGPWASTTRRAPCPRTNRASTPPAMTADRNVTRILYTSNMAHREDLFAPDPSDRDTVIQVCAVAPIYLPHLFFPFPRVAQHVFVLSLFFRLEKKERKRKRLSHSFLFFRDTYIYG